jgi:hypothetical protein
MRQCSLEGKSSLEDRFDRISVHVGRICHSTGLKNHYLGFEIECNVVHGLDEVVLDATAEYGATTDLQPLQFRIFNESSFYALFPQLVHQNHQP